MMWTWFWILIEHGRGNSVSSIVDIVGEPVMDIELKKCRQEDGYDANLVKRFEDRLIIMDGSEKQQINEFIKEVMNKRGG